MVSVIQPNPRQQARDAAGLRHTCAACGGPETARDQLVVASDGFRVHTSHVTDPDSGYYCEPFAEVSP